MLRFGKQYAKAVETLGHALKVAAHGSNGKPLSCMLQPIRLDEALSAATQHNSLNTSAKHSCSKPYRHLQNRQLTNPGTKNPS